MTSSAPASIPTGTQQPAATHPCVRCGRPVALDVGLCEECNPLGLSDSASSQVHGTVFLGIVIAVVVMAVAAKLAVGGGGPFHASLVEVQASGTGLSLTIDVRNAGRLGGAATCQVSDPAAAGRSPVSAVRSPRIEPGETTRFSAEVQNFGASPRPLLVACDGP
jgi:hypothetical protein